MSTEHRLYQRKTGEPCGCKPGKQRDNCPECEGTGQKIDYVAIRARSKAKVVASKLGEQEMARRGALLAKVLRLRRDYEYKDRWKTEWGTKTDLGLFRIVERIMEEGE